MSAPEQIEKARRHSDTFRSTGFYLLVIASVLLGLSGGLLSSTIFVFIEESHIFEAYLLGYVGSAILVLASVLYAVAGVLVPVAEWYAHYHTPRQE